MVPLAHLVVECLGSRFHIVYTQSQRQLLVLSLIIYSARSTYVHTRGSINDNFPFNGSALWFLVYESSNTC
jgi:hypothetical protein